MKNFLRDDFVPSLVSGIAVFRKLDPLALGPPSLFVTRVICPLKDPSFLEADVWVGCYDVCVRLWATVKRKEARKHKAQKTVMSPELPTISGTVNTNKYNDAPRTSRDLDRKAPIRPATPAATAVPWTRIRRNMTPAFVSVVPPPL